MRSLVAVESAFAIAPPEQPAARPLQHVLVNVAHLRHVGELHQTIRRERFMSRIAAKPFIASTA
jgi:hypothetical protein